MACLFLFCVCGGSYAKQEISGTGTDVAAERCG